MLRTELNTSFNIKYRFGGMKRYLSFNAYIGKNVVSELTTFDSYHQNLSMTGIEGGRDLFLEQYYFVNLGLTQYRLFPKMYVLGTRFFRFYVDVASFFEVFLCFLSIYFENNFTKMRN